MKFLKNAVKVTAAVPAAWIAYSNLFIDHEMDLPPSLPTEVKIYDSRPAGLVAYYHDGSGEEGIPLVLVHSVNAAASAKEMQPLFNWARGRRPVFALDLPGYGHSDRTDRIYSPQLFADTITEFLRDVVGRPAHVVALSLGCEFAARAAVANPKWFQTLTMISPTGFRDRSDTDRSAKNENIGQGSDRAYRLLSFPLWSQPLFDLITSRPSIRYYLEKSFSRQEPPGELLSFGYRSAHRPGAKNVPLYFLSGKLFTRDIEQTLYPKLTMPVMVLFDEDPYISFEKLPDFVSRHPQWTAVRIGGTKGLPHWERPLETFQALDRFFEEITLENQV